MSFITDVFLRTFKIFKTGTLKSNRIFMQCVLCKKLMGLLTQRLNKECFKFSNT